VFRVVVALPVPWASGRSPVADTARERAVRRRTARHRRSGTVQRPLITLPAAMSALGPDLTGLLVGLARACVSPTRPAVSTPTAVHVRRGPGTPW